MLQRLLIAGVAAGALLVTGCGTNSKLGIDVSLEPDLVPKKVIETDDSDPVLDGIIKLEVTVANEGGVDSRKFRIRTVGYHVDCPNPPYPPSIGDTTFVTIDEGLGAGEAIQVPITLNVPDQLQETNCGTTFTGNWVIVIEVDFQDDVRESNESNNTITLNTIVSAGGSGGDPDVIDTRKPSANN